MPQVRQYKKGSIIYFEGEKKDKFAYLLKSGNCSRSKFSIDTNMTENNPLVVGEFFGIKGALGVLPRDETIRVLADSVVYIFTPQEFIDVIKKNISIIFKMLKAFSTELRRIHRAIENKLSVESQSVDELNSADKLKNIGYYYLKRQAHSQAKYVFEKYLENYPTSESGPEVKDQVEILNGILKEKQAELQDAGEAQGDIIEQEASKPVSGPVFIDPPESLEKEVGQDDVIVSFNQLVDDYLNHDYVSAKEKSIKIDTLVIEDMMMSKFYEKFLLLKAKVYYCNNNYAEGIEVAKDFIKQFSASRWIPNALLVIAESFVNKGNMQNGRAVYEKIMASNDSTEEIKEVVKARLARLGVS